VQSRVTIALLVWAAWTALAVFFAISTSLTYISQGRAPVWGLALSVALASWWIWAALTPLVVWLARWMPLSRRRLAIHLPILLAGGVAVAFLKVTVEGWIRLWMLGQRPYVLISNLALQVLIYWAIVAVVHALDHYGRSRARAAQVEARLGEAQLQLLRQQLRPHFLFNALNAISELVHEDPAAADRMLDRLSALLRATLHAEERHLVPLSEEIDLAEHYLAIQQVRFSDRLHVIYDVPAGVRDLPVPTLLLQPLIENAIQHGISARASGGSVRIAGAIRDDRLWLTVSDDGLGFVTGTAEGIGLTNTRGRLQSLYNGGASFDIAAAPGGGTDVTIGLPIATSSSGVTGAAR
jgi:sensor histidine kinase YesM